MDHPLEKAMRAAGEEFFYRRAGIRDFSCATCHAATGKRIRASVLPNANVPEEWIKAISWPAFRVGHDAVRGSQHRPQSAKPRLSHQPGPALDPTILEKRKGRVQRGPLAKRIPFYNMRYDKGAEQKPFDTLSGRIQVITAIFGTVPDFIVDEWVTDMLEDKAWDESTILTNIAERQENPFTLKETTESLDSDWEGTVEVLNQHEAFRALLGGW